MSLLVMALFTNRFQDVRGKSLTGVDQLASRPATQ